MANVILLAHTPNPEQTVAAAAKLCYSSSDITGLTDSLTEEKAAALRLYGEFWKRGCDAPRQGEGWDER